MRPRVFFLAVATATCLMAAAGYKVGGHWKTGGEGATNAVYADADARRLYVSRAGKSAVLDSDSGRIVGEIAGISGIHGIAIAGKEGLGLTANGADNSVSVFNLKTLSFRTKMKAGDNPKSILYEPTANVAIAFNERSRDATVISVEGLAVLNTVSLGARPESSATDGKGNVWVNLGDRNALAKMGGAPLRVLNTWPLQGCAGPTGLAVDVRSRRVFSVCGNKLLIAVDADSGRAVAKLPIGAGASGVAFDPVFMNILVADGMEGAVTVFHETNPDRFSLAGSVITRKGAQAISVDAKTGNAFLPAAALLPLSPGDLRDGAKPGSLEILVLSR